MQLPLRSKMRCGLAWLKTLNSEIRSASPLASIVSAVDLQATYQVRFPKIKKAGI